MRIVHNTDGSRAPFDFITITLHWLTATLIVFQAASGLTLEFARDAVPMRPLLDLHRSAGAILWFLALTRIVWRWTFAEFPPFPDWMSNAQRWIATKTEYVLYGLLFLQPVTGFAATLMLGKQFHLLFLTVPAFFHRNLDLWESLIALHRIGAYGLFAAVGVHAGTALIHHYVFGDEILERMAPWMRRKRPGSHKGTDCCGSPAPAQIAKRSANPALPGRGLADSELFTARARGASHLSAASVDLRRHAATVADEIAAEVRTSKQAMSINAVKNR